MLKRGTFVLILSIVFLLALKISSSAEPAQTPSSVTIIGDSEPPEISYAIGTLNSGEISRAPIFVKVETEDTDISYLVFELYNSSGLVNSTQVSSETREFYWNNIPAGNYFYNVTAVDTSQNSNSTSTRNITIIASCTEQCTEGENCVISSACWMNNGGCSGGVCNFQNLSVNSNVYTLHDSDGNGENLNLNLSGEIRFASGTNFFFGGRNGSNISPGSVGGNGSVVNITVPGLFNTTNAKFVGNGGYTTLASTAGGNGGTLQLNYHGLIGKFTNLETPVPLPSTSAGSSLSALSGTAGSTIYVKNLDVCPRDPDINDDGIFTFLGDIALGIQPVYRNSTFPKSTDLNCDEIVNVIDLTRIGFVWNTR